MALLKMTLRFKLLVPFINFMKQSLETDTQEGRNREHNKMSNFEG